MSWARNHLHLVPLGAGTPCANAHACFTQCACDVRDARGQDEVIKRRAPTARRPKAGETIIAPHTMMGRNDDMIIAFAHSPRISNHTCVPRALCICGRAARTIFMTHRLFLGGGGGGVHSLCNLSVCVYLRARASYSFLALQKQAKSFLCSGRAHHQHAPGALQSSKSRASER